MRILLVEDDPKVSGFLAQGLSEEGHQVVVEGNGRLALTRALRDPWDVILLDFMLPGMSGVDLARELRRQGRELPILMLTARDSEQDRQRCLDAGVTDFLAKPFRFADLLDRLDRLLPA
jgi:DNA-binding response OmpR family regulator